MTRVNVGDGEEGRAFGVVSVSSHCIYVLIVGIDISVKNHIVTEILSSTCMAPIKCSMLPNPAPFLMLFPSKLCHDPK